MVFAAFNSRQASTNSSTPPANKTGAPGSGTCAECHSPASGGNGSASISFGGGLTTYTPGTTYDMSITINDPGQKRWGFSMVARNAANQNVGTWIVTNTTNTQIHSSGTHMSHKNAPNNIFDTFTFSFQWTAPAAGTGKVTFYTSANAANGNGSTNGDYIYTTNLMVEEEVALPPTISFSTFNPFCSDSNDGSATVIPEGGTAPYSYLWLTGATTQTINNLGGGTYEVTVTDDSGQTAVGAVTINDPAAMNLNITPVDASCGSCNGQAIWNVGGGQPPYAFAWSGGTPDLTNICPGTYTITITDSNGCSVSEAFSIASASDLTVDLVSVEDATCGEANGNILLATSGGTGAITFAWIGGASTGPALNSLAAGTYSITATDAAGCTDIIAVTVGSTSAIEVLANEVTNTSCGDDNGVIMISAAGGAGNYTYAWTNNVSTGSVAANLPAGNYTVTVTDAEGCSGQRTVSVGDSEAIQMTVLSSPSCDNLATGALNVDAISGGTPFYTYNWSNGSVGNPLENVAAGTYTVTATDSEGCTATSTVTVEEIICVGINDLSATEVFSIYPNPTNGAINLTLSPEWVNRATVVQLYNTLGQKVWEQAVGASAVIRAEMLPVGSYLLSIQLEGGRKVSQLVVINN